MNNLSHLATRRTLTAIRHFPSPVLEQLTFDFQELSWLKGSLRDDDFYRISTINYGDGRGTCLYLWLPQSKQGFRLTIDEALELVALLAEHVMRPEMGMSSGKVVLRVLQGGRA